MNTFHMLATFEKHFRSQYRAYLAPEKLAFSTGDEGFNALDSHGV